MGKSSRKKPGGGDVTITKIHAGDAKTFPAAGDSLTMHYVGTLKEDGSEFDSSRAKQKPFVFTLGAGNVIRGWEIGVAKMSLGERSKLTISPEAGYGEAGCENKANASGTGVIPPNAWLVFDVELLDINGKRSLGKYLLTLDSWVQGKLQKYDSDAATRAALDAKHGSRDEYVSHLSTIVEQKYEVERAKKGEKAPTMEQITAELVATTEQLEADAAKVTEKLSTATLGAAASDVEQPMAAAEEQLDRMVAAEALQELT